MHIVDTYALGDPLLARLPSHEKWRIGHYTRDLPEGYIETLETGQNKIKDPGIAQYYDKLRIVVSGPLFSWERMVEIWKLNTGAYNHLLPKSEPTTYTPGLPGPTSMLAIALNQPIWRAQAN